MSKILRTYIFISFVVKYWVCVRWLISADTHYPLKLCEMRTQSCINVEFISCEDPVDRKKKRKKNEKDICLFIGWFVYDVLMLLISQNRGIFYCIYGNYERCHTAKRWLFKVFLIFIFSLFNIYERNRPIEIGVSGSSIETHAIIYCIDRDICVELTSTRARFLCVYNKHTVYSESITKMTTQCTQTAWSLIGILSELLSINLKMLY